MAIETPPLIPVRILNEFVYCPRLAYLEWVQSEFRDNEFTAEGRYDHRRVDDPGPGKKLDDNDQETPSEIIHKRSVRMSSERLGLITVIDLIDEHDGKIVPVDYKHGTKPDVEGGIRDPERIQLAAQACILVENGYSCQEGLVYYVKSKTRISVPFDDCTRQQVEEITRQVRDMAEKGQIPPPLIDSPKCPRCSLVTICLPDEVSLLNEVADREQPLPLRQLVPARQDALPLYVHTQGSRIGISGDCLVIHDKDDEKHEVRLIETSQVAVFGGVGLSTPAVHALCTSRIPVCYFSHSGWFYGITTATAHKNIDLRTIQFTASRDPEIKLILARRFVESKIKNCRTMLRRNATGEIGEAVKSLSMESERIQYVSNLESLLGFEGNAARIYFNSFSCMLKNFDSDNGLTFDFERRNRRPPRDPVNALLSLAYSLLTRDFFVTILSCGLDPYLGFYHSEKYGRPALALDLMEEFRPIIADSTVIAVINNRIVIPGDFVRSGSAVNLNEKGRKKFIQAYERRMDQLVTHPVFNYRISYRQVLEVQTRLLGRFLLNEIPDYPSFQTR